MNADAVVTIGAILAVLAIRFVADGELEDDAKKGGHRATTIWAKAVLSCIATACVVVVYLTYIQGYL